MLAGCGVLDMTGPDATLTTSALGAALELCLERSEVTAAGAALRLDVRPEGSDEGWSPVSPVQDGFGGYMVAAGEIVAAQDSYLFTNYDQAQLEELLFRGFREVESPVS
jgi:hypothetical protein